MCPFLTFLLICFQGDKFIEGRMNIWDGDTFPAPASTLKDGYAGIEIPLPLFGVIINFGYLHRSGSHKNI